MCGIAGILGSKIGETEINAAIEMRDMLRHRGPDAEGIWISDFGDAVLTHRRLSILDLSDSGKQPMLSRRERYVISFNGEIYNYQELATKLQMERNYSFRGTSDTEVLLGCFEEYGIDGTLALCKGMFAIALYDRQEHNLMLVRDRMGEKPLYYGYINNAFAFASELQCLEKISYESLTLDYFAINEFIERGYITGNRTIYQGIYKLRAGEMLCVDQNSTIIRQAFYWKYQDATLAGKRLYAEMSLQDTAKKLEEMLEKTISKQMLADVPVGAFLSSGIDSSLIVSLMQKQSMKKIKTFSIGVEDKEYNEANEAKKIAECLATDHTELYVTERDMKDIIPLLSEVYSEPFGDPSAIPSLLVSKLAKTQVTVCLTGDGGDELFGGYPLYLSLPRKWGILKRMPIDQRTWLSKKIAQHSWCMSKEEVVKRVNWLQANSIEKLYDNVRYGLPSNNEWCVLGHTEENTEEVRLHGVQSYSERMMYYDAVTYLPEDILAKMDRASMKYSLETRAPFLDRDIVQFAGGMCFTNKIDKGIGKIVLREILYKYVPQQLICQQKKGFSVPVSSWLREDRNLKCWANSLLDSRRIRRQGILKADQVERVWKAYTEQGKYSTQIWNLLMFESWCENKKY